MDVYPLGTVIKIKALCELSSIMFYGIVVIQTVRNLKGFICAVEHCHITAAG